MPVEWRPYVRAGILEWNRAFEDAGFRDAIRVLDAPDDSAWSAADARYSTVRWTANNRAVYAIGPTNVDPRTGEILNADILISAAWIQSWRGRVGRVRRRPWRRCNRCFGGLARAGRPADEPRLCRYGDGIGREGTLARALLAARGEIAGRRRCRGSTSARRSRRWSCTRWDTPSACATTSAAPPAISAAQLADRDLHRRRTASACR